jgi:hypothetical protein
MLFRMFNRHHAIGDVFEGGGALAQRSHRSFPSEALAQSCPSYSPLRLVAKSTTDKSIRISQKMPELPNFAQESGRD